MTTALEGGEWSAARPGRTRVKDPGTHCTGGWVGPRTGLDRCGKSRPPPGFDPWTVQPVAQSLYRLSYPAHIPVSRSPKFSTVPTKSTSVSVNIRPCTTNVSMYTHIQYLDFIGGVTLMDESTWSKDEPRGEAGQFVT
jgi:hypothetical protein